MFEISVLVSGSGSTLDNLAFHCYDDVEGIMRGMVTITSVFADRNCGALEVAEGWGIPKFVLDTKSILKKAGNVDLCVLAGFLSKIYVPPEMEGKILNIHPSLLPKYGGKGMYGRKVHQAVKESGDSITGCTVHVVDNEYDHGEIVDQELIPIMPEQSADDLEMAVKKLEQQLYPKAILNFLSKQPK